MAKPRNSAPPGTATVTVIHAGVSREIPYRPYLTVWTILAAAVRAHGKRFSKENHLRLHNADGAELPCSVRAQDAGIQAGAELTLKPPTIEGN
jgi:hypothetical protein